MLQRPDTHADGYEVKKLTGAPRFCRMCQCYKPARTHHCRDCNRFVAPSSRNDLQLTPGRPDVCCAWVCGDAESRGLVILMVSFNRSPLPLDQQLCRPLQLQSFPPIPFLCRPRLFIPLCHARQASSLCHGWEVLGMSFFSVLILIYCRYSFFTSD